MSGSEAQQLYEAVNIDRSAEINYNEVGVVLLYKFICIHSTGRLIAEVPHTMLGRKG